MFRFFKVPALAFFIILLFANSVIADKPGAFSEPGQSAVAESGRLALETVLPLDGFSKMINPTSVIEYASLVAGDLSCGDSDKGPHGDGCECDPSDPNTIYAIKEIAMVKGWVEIPLINVFGIPIFNPDVWVTVRSVLHSPCDPLRANKITVEVFAYSNDQETSMYSEHEFIELDAPSILSNNFCKISDEPKPSRLIDVGYPLSPEEFRARATLLVAIEGLRMGACFVDEWF